MEIYDRNTQNAVELVPFPGEDPFLKPERVQELLQALPGWQLVASGKAIQGSRTLPTAQVAALFAAYASTYGKAMGQQVGLGLRDGFVQLTLSAPSTRGDGPGGLTETVFELAHRIG